MTLVGNYEWKSRELIEPYDHFMEGSIFADFIGDYADIPGSIKPITDGQPFLTNPMDARRVDYNLIGYHSAWLSFNTLLKEPKTRQNFTSIIANLKVKNSKYFENGPLFDSSRASIWPSFIFKISEGQLRTTLQ